MLIVLAALSLAADPAAAPHPVKELRGALEEVRQNVEGIRGRVRAYKELNGAYHPCGSPEIAKERGKVFERTTWEGGACWTVLAYDDPGQMRGGYWVVVAADGNDVEIHGVIDADGDGVFAEYVAKADTVAAAVTPADEY